MKLFGILTLYLVAVTICIVMIFRLYKRLRRWTPWTGNYDDFRDIFMAIVILTICGDWLIQGPLPEIVAENHKVRIISTRDMSRDDRMDMLCDMASDAVLPALTGDSPISDIMTGKISVIEVYDLACGADFADEYSRIRQKRPKESHP